MEKQNPSNHNNHRFPPPTANDDEIRYRFGDEYDICPSRCEMSGSQVPVLLGIRETVFAKDPHPESVQSGFCALNEKLVKIMLTQCGGGEWDRETVVYHRLHKRIYQRQTIIVLRYHGVLFRIEQSWKPGQKRSRSQVL